MKCTFGRIVTRGLRIEERAGIRLAAVIATALSIPSFAAAQQPPPVPLVPQTYANDVRFPAAVKTAPSMKTGGSCVTQYIPTADTPLQTLAMNFHIYQRSDGSGNWQDTPFDRSQLQLLIDVANRYNTTNPAPSDPCPGTAYTVSDTRIRYALKNVYFYRSNTLYVADPKVLQQRSFLAYPGAKAQLNVYFNQRPTNPGSGEVDRLASEDLSVDHWVHMPLTYTGGSMSWATTGTFRHEIGHILGLGHAYDSETCDTDSCEYLSDLFCGATCPQEGGWNCNPLLPANTCTNNLMGGTQGEGFLTDLQVGKMHRALQTRSPKKYLDPAGCVAPPADLVLWLPLDEPGGTTATNVTGPGGLRKGALTVGPDLVNRGICFDAPAPAWVEVPGYAAINGLHQFSVELWVRRMPFDNGARVLVDKRQQVGGIIRGFSLSLQAGFPMMELTRSASPVRITGTVRVPDDNRYHHLAATYVTNHPAGLRFYIDGAPAGAALTTVGAPPIGTVTPLRVGSSPATWLPQMQGCIDEVSLYSRALARAEIAAIATARGAGKCQLFTMTPGETSFCRNNSTVRATARVCNASTTARTVAYSFEPLAAGATCTIAGPTVFTPSAKGTVTVPAGGCVDVPITIARPAAMTAQGQRACYSLTVTAGDQTFRMQGSLVDTRNDCTNSPGDRQILRP
jgi:hypothetical protein